jgi:hypothetical protein
LQFDLNIKTDHRPPGQIFDEGLKLHPNSVNDCFPDGRNGLLKSVRPDRPNVPPGPHVLFD